MVEITCPFCEQTHNRDDLHQLAEVEVSPEEAVVEWTEEEVRSFMRAFNEDQGPIPDDAFECGAPLSGDGDNYCTREVDSPGEVCWQHPDE